jgi:peptidoglycan/LPS O-acetylase OafA/YrhL
VHGQHYGATGRAGSAHAGIARHAGRVGLQTMIKSFEGARGLAALLVALFHLRLATFVPFIAFGYLFVDLFFVLSGFLICSLYVERLERKDQFAPFVIRRFGRLFPLLIASTIAFVLVSNIVAFGKNEAVARGLAKFSSGIAAVPYMIPTLAELTSTLTMTHGMGLFDKLILNSVSWSISVEFYTYLLFAGLCLLVPRKHRLPLFVLLAVGGYLLTAWATLHRHNCLVEGHCFDVTYDFGFARCVSAFFLGAITWFMSRRFASLAEGRRTALQWLALGAIGVVFTFADRMPLLTLTCPAVFALLVFSLEKDSGPLARLLKRPVFQLLGERSYSVYMVHPIIIIVLAQVHKKLAGGPILSAVTLIIYAVGVVWVAGYSYRWIEAPCRDYFNRIADRLKRQAAEVEGGSAAKIKDARTRMPE